MKFIKKLIEFSWGTMLSTFIGIIQVPIITMFIVPSEYGKAGLFRSIIMQIPVLLYLGLDHSMSREYHDREDKRLLFQQITWLPIIITLIFTTISFVFSEYISIWFFSSPEYSSIIYLTGFWLLLTVIERFILLDIRMSEEANKFSMITFFIKFSNFIFTMIFIFLGFRSFLVPIYGLLIGHILVNACLVFYKRSLFKLDKNFIEPNFLIESIKFGFPQMLSIFMSTGVLTITNVVLNSYANAYELGLFNLGMSLSAMIGVVRTSFNTFWLPTSYKWYSINKSIKHFKAISDILILCLSIVLMIIFFSKDLLMLFVDDSYWEVQFIFGGFALTQLIMIQSETVSLGILFSRKTIYNVLISGILFVTNISLNYLFIPDFGVYGATISLIISYFMFYISRMLVSKKLGFYFSQYRQLSVISLLIIFSFINMWNFNLIHLVNLVGLALLLLIQIPTILQLFEIKNNEDSSWDFD